VVALVVTVAVIILPFGIALVLDRSGSVTIEPLARWAGVAAILIAPVVCVIMGLRRGLRLRVALITAAGIMSFACLALLFGLTSTQGVVQSQIAAAIAAVALTTAVRVRSSIPRDAPPRPDRSHPLW
jgi:bacteriorhodopsin